MKHIDTRKSAALAGTAALVAGAALWPSVAGADPTGQRGGHLVVGPFRTDRVEERFIDNDRNQRASFGDEIVFTDASRGPLGRGTNYGRCMLHEVAPTAATATATATVSTTLHCSSVTQFDRSSVTFQGTARVTLPPPPGTPELLEPASSAITGGTGRFLRARGDITITRVRGTGLDFRQSGRVRVVLAP
jgi:hypothetical protein